MTNKRRPGVVRDAIVEYLRRRDAAHVKEILAAVEQTLGEPVAASSVRSYLRLNTPEKFKRMGKGRYTLVKKSA
jgi:site-specific DNA-methyltransferase (adenine-specific)